MSHGYGRGASVSVSGMSGLAGPMPAPMPTPLPAPLSSAGVSHAAAGGAAPSASETEAQTFLHGHTAPICQMALSQDSSLLASAQEGKFPMIRLWLLKKKTCAAILTAHDSGVCALDFSVDDRLLVGVGKDERSRTLIVVWDVSRAPLALDRSVKIPVVARQLSEFEVRRVRFSPYDVHQLVTCGRENIRFWRMKSGHLRGCPVILNEYARDTQFTDLAFESSYGPRPVGGAAQRHVYVSTENGTVVQIEYDSKSLACVYKLHDGAICSIAVNEGFCVTGSDDKFLRVWPLDFSDFFLEAEHEGAVVSVDVSQDGLRLAIGTQDGTLGVLDVASHAYQTILRSHTKAVLAVAADPNPANREFASVSEDGTIRVWSLDSFEQL